MGSAQDHRYPQVPLVAITNLRYQFLWGRQECHIFYRRFAKQGSVPTSKPEMQCEIIVLMWDHDLHSEYVGGDGISDVPPLSQIHTCYLHKCLEFQGTADTAARSLSFAKGPIESVKEIQKRDPVLSRCISKFFMQVE